LYSAADFCRDSPKVMTQIDNWLPYFVYLLPLLAIAFFAGRRKVRVQAANAAIAFDSLEAGVVAPPSLHPVIDHTRCIGCQACVRACPEFPAHTVLGVVRGKANLVSPSDCIDHGACKTACPVDAIRLLFGTAETRRRHPIRDAHVRNERGRHLRRDWYTRAARPVIRAHNNGSAIWPTSRPNSSQ
jgi:ferredoxin